MKAIVQREKRIAAGAKNQKARKVTIHGDNEKSGNNLISIKY